MTAKLGIAIAKGIAAALTGSSALVAETLHSVADAGNEVLLYVAVRRSDRPADPLHPLGHGPERFYWALLAAIGMFLIGGAVSIWEGINTLVEPRELANQAVPPRYVERLRARLERQPGIEDVPRLEAVYLGASDVLVAADVVMSPELGLEDAARSLARARARVREEAPMIARLYLTPVPRDGRERDP